jgi:hypothetical protein
MAAEDGLINGSSGLVGSEAVAFLDARFWTMHDDIFGDLACSVTPTTGTLR